MIQLFFGFFFVVTVCVADSPEWMDSDSNIFGPKYSEILSMSAALAAQNTDRVKLIDYGSSIEGRKLRLLVLMRQDLNLSNRPALYVTGSIHGNEYLNIEDRLPAVLVGKTFERGVIRQFFDSGGAFVFVPIVNPDGYEHRQRGNAHGADLNRDWDVPPAHFQGFKEIETQTLSTALDGLSREFGLNYRVTIDYHCCVGALLHPWSYLEQNVMNPADLEAHRKIGALARASLGSEVEVGTTGEVLGYYPEGTTKDYFYDRYQALSFTYEGRYGQENQFFGKHVAWWEAITTHVLGEVRTRAFLGVPPKARVGFLRIAD